MIETIRQHKDSRLILDIAEHQQKIIKREKLRLIANNYQHNYTKNKRKNDISYRVLCYLRTRLWKTLKQNKRIKSTSELVGCSIEDLRFHLQKNFKEGMSWDNYGTWHIDHIRPCSSFDLSKFEEQEKCFHYSNLQPLWALENLQKGSSY